MDSESLCPVCGVCVSNFSNNRLFKEHLESHVLNVLEKIYENVKNKAYKYYLIKNFENLKKCDLSIFEPKKWKQIKNIVFYYFKNI